MMQQLISDGPVSPVCPFCDERVDGFDVNGMHPECYNEYGDELEESFPLELDQLIMLSELESKFIDENEAVPF